jgi:hypothetical protein
MYRPEQNDNAVVRLPYLLLPSYFILQQNITILQCPADEKPGILCTHDTHARAYIPWTTAMGTRLESYRHVKFVHPKEVYISAYVEIEWTKLNSSVMFFIVVKGGGINLQWDGINYFVTKRNHTMNCDPKTISGPLRTLINEKPSANAILGGYIVQTRCH